jgi:hypothetical protein
MTCPHRNPRFCPLYVACHDPLACGLGCDDGRMGEGGCAADRGLDYDMAVARLHAARPRIVAVCEFNAAAQAGRDQRARNLRLNGVH